MVSLSTEILDEPREHNSEPAKTPFIRKRKGVKARLASRGIYFERKRDTQDTVILASMGRSGSTIFSNVINYNNDYRVLFEPFFTDKVERAKDFEFPLYLRPDSDDSKYLHPAEDIVSGKVKGRWIDRETTSIFPQRRLIKEIRANLFLKWLHVHFEGLKPVLLLRHPCAVVESWMAMNFGEGIVSRDRLLANSDFMQDFGDSIKDEYLRAETSFERLMFFWCIYYKVPLIQFGELELKAVFYENMVQDPENELGELFQFLGQDYSEREVRNLLADPSSTTRETSEVKQGGNRITGWKDRVDPKQIDRAYEIMQLFGMDKLYDVESAMPDRNVLTNLFDARKL